MAPHEHGALRLEVAQAAREGRAGALERLGLAVDKLVILLLAAAKAGELALAFGDVLLHVAQLLKQGVVPHRSLARLGALAVEPLVQAAGEREEIAREAFRLEPVDVLLLVHALFAQPLLLRGELFAARVEVAQAGPELFASGNLGAKAREFAVKAVHSRTSVSLLRPY